MDPRPAGVFPLVPHRSPETIARRTARMSTDELHEQLRGRTARLCFFLSWPDCPQLLRRQEERMVSETTMALLLRDPAFVAFENAENAKRRADVEKAAASRSVPLRGPRRHLELVALPPDSDPQPSDE